MVLMPLSSRAARRALTIGLIALVAALACSPDRKDGDLFAPGGDGIPVVNSMLMVGKPFPLVYLSRTLRPDQEFSWDLAGIAGASVSIEGDGATIAYHTGATFPGAYYTTSFDTVRANTTYRLTATLPDGQVLHATTTTPSAINVTEWVLLNNEASQVVQRLSTFQDYPVSPDTLYTVPENQLVFPEGLLEVRLGAGAAAGYQVGLQSLDINSPLLISTDFLSEEDVAKFTRFNESPPLAATKGTLRVPWFAIFYEGRYKMWAYCMDRNWFDLARTDPVLGAGGVGFGGPAGDSTEPPIFHVEGGIGLFGSMSADSVGFYVNPPAK